jgi:DNA polymerase-1
VKGLTLLLDADIIIYRAATVHQRVTDWGDGNISVATDPIEEAILTMQHEVDEYQVATGAKRLVWCVSDSSDRNFRKLILPTYKFNRPVKPVLCAPLKAWVLANTKSYLRPTLEGDDVMGILATHPKLLPGKKMIVSIDKDMKTIPTTIYNPGKGTEVTYTPEESDYWHLYQTLMGDTTDGYKGCPGVGKVNAARILHGVECPHGASSPLAWHYVVSAFKHAGLTEEHALVQARVARILRHTDYDYKTKQPILWSPPK